MSIVLRGIAPFFFFLPSPPPAFLLFPLLNLFFLLPPPPILRRAAATSRGRLLPPSSERAAAAISLSHLLSSYSPQQTLSGCCCSVVGCRSQNRKSFFCDSQNLLKKVPIFKIKRTLFLYRLFDATAPRMSEQGVSAVLNPPGGGEATFSLQNRGGSTQLAVTQRRGGSSSSSSSSCFSGRWRNPPVVLSDGASQVAIFVEGDNANSVMTVQLRPGGCSVSSSSMNRESFDQRYADYHPLSVN